MEIWKDIKNYEGYYQVSNFGNIRSLHKRNKYNLMKLPIKRGYYQIGLRKDGTRKFCQVHRLVAQAFIDNPLNLPQVNHKDENKLNNIVDNLEWCTVSYNNCYGTRLERVSNSCKNKRPVLYYDINKNLIAEYPSLSEASRITKVRASEIVRSCKKTKTAPRKYIFRYKEEVV